MTSYKSFSPVIRIRIFLSLLVLFSAVFYFDLIFGEWSGFLKGLSGTLLIGAATIEMVLFSQRRRIKNL